MSSMSEVPPKGENTSGILLYYYNNNIPEACSPFGGSSDMEYIHTTYHTPLKTTKTNSVQKDKIKPHIQHLRYPYTSENTKIQLTPVDKLGQDQTSLSPSVTSILTVLSFRAESLCTHRALYGYLVNIPKTARSQV